MILYNFRDVIYDILCYEYNHTWYHVWFIFKDDVWVHLNPVKTLYAAALAGALASADIPPAQHTDACNDSLDSDSDREKDSKYVRDFADQSPGLARRRSDSCYSFETHSLVLEHSWHHWTWMQPTSSRRANTFFRSTSINTISMQLTWETLTKGSSPTRF